MARVSMLLGVLSLLNPCAQLLGQNTFPTSGSVGVGTTAPSYPLQVVGNIKSGGLVGSATGITIGNHGAELGAIEFNQSDNSRRFWLQTNGVNSSMERLSLYGGPLNANATQEMMSFSGTGNVGIGTTSPAARLEVSGNVKLTAGSGANLIFQDGSVQSTAWNGVLSGGDYAESVDVIGERNDYEPGDVLVIDPTSPGKFLKSATPYSTAVAGIYSTKPGVRGRRQGMDSSHMKDEVPMAMVGVVPTKVSAESGPIRSGDLLVTSSRPGYAMKGTDRALLAGAIVGKAMANLESGVGVIEVLVSLQ